MSMTGHIITILVAVFASTGFWAFISNVYNNKRNKKSAETEMLLGLAHDRIYDLCKGYIKEGTITHYEYDNLQYLYKPYIKLGGNGTAEKLMDEVEKLPMSDE